MPIYAYRCEACGHAKDVLQKFSDPLLTVCPSCGAEAFKKQVTAAGFQLKGSGWYVTDFRGDGKAAKPAAEGTSSGAPQDGAAPAGAAKPADGGGAKSEEGKSAAAPADGGKGASAPGKTGSAPAAPAAAPAASPPAGSGTSAGGR